jgi:hypothetical protein
LGRWDLEEEVVEAPTRGEEARRAKELGKEREGGRERDRGCVRLPFWFSCVTDGNGTRYPIILRVPALNREDLI